MAKDGTLRGGARPGSGQKKKPLNDRIMEGNLSHRPLKVIELKAVDLPVDEVHPKPKEFLSDEQHEVGCRWYAEEIYEATLYMARQIWMRTIGATGICRTLCHEPGRMDSMRGSCIKVWPSLQAPDDAGRYRIPSGVHGQHLPQSGKSRLGRNLSGGQGKFPGRLSKCSTSW